MMLASSNTLVMKPNNIITQHHPTNNPRSRQNHRLQLKIPRPSIGESALSRMAFIRIKYAKVYTGGN